MSDDQDKPPEQKPGAQVYDMAAEKRNRGLRELVSRRAAQPVVEWLFYLEEDAKKFSLEPTALKQMIEAVVRERERQEREQRTETRDLERRATQQKRETERQETIQKRETSQRDRALRAIFKLPASEHESELNRIAKQLGADIGSLKAEFEILLAEEKKKTSGGVEPWPEQVKTPEALEQLSAQLAKYLIVHDQHAATAMALWAMFAWVHDIATFSPMLVIQSADADAAKTTACKVIAKLTPRAFVIAEPTGPSFYRFVDRTQPTLIIDEADQLLARRTDLAHLINVSWTKGTFIQRVGSNGDIHRFDPFCPKILSGIDLAAHLRPATRTRCITINLLPKLDDEKVANYRHADDDADFFMLQRKLMRWAIDYKQIVKKANPEMPDGFTNRQEENFVLLFAIADLAGGDWGKKMRDSARALSHTTEPSLGRLLLADMRRLFKQHGKRIHSKQLVTLLIADEEGEWAHYRGQGPITAHQVARLLKPFGIQPDFVVVDKVQQRGYNEAWFETAFKHYLKVIK